MPENVVSDVIKLRMARDGLAGNDWTKNKLGLAKGVPHCVIGWLLQAVEFDEMEAARLVVDYVYPALPTAAKKDRTPIEAVYRFNDHSSRHRTDVVALLDRAIGLVKAE
jgi:hypothetical protein